MKHSLVKMGLRGVATVLAVGALGTVFAHAEYPDRPITVIVPNTPGGNTDTGIRIWVPYMEKCLGQPLVILNKPGGGGSIGMNELAQAKPDGYTIGSLGETTVLTAAVTKGGKAIMDNFTYLGSFYEGYPVIAVAKTSEIKTLKDLVERSQSNPIVLASTSIGSSHHLALLQLSEVSGLKFRLIPAEGSPQAREELLGGHVEAASLAVSDASAYLDGIRPLAVFSTHSLRSLPGVPTIKEAGYDLAPRNSSIVAMPAKAPKEAQDKIIDCMSKTAAEPSLAEEASKRGMEFEPHTGAEVKAELNAQYERLNALWKTSPWIK